MSNTIKNRIEFENIYVAHYSRMKRFAQEYVIREEDAENIVQDVFLDLWEQNLLLLTHTNLFAYLFTSVKNRCIDFLRHKTIVQNTAQKLQDDYTKALQMKFQSLLTSTMRHPNRPPKTSYRKVERLIYALV